MSHLVRHIGTSAIMDLLLRLITCIENFDTRHACVNVSVVSLFFAGLHFILLCCKLLKCSDIDVIVVFLPCSANDLVPGNVGIFF